MKKMFTTLQYFVITLLCLFCTRLNAQNLIPNYGFELQDSCPLVSEIFVAPPWNSPTLGTPDVFNSTCPTQNISAHTGIGSSGVFTFNTFPNNREYIQAPLTTPLVQGQIYCVSFWVKRVNYRYATNRMGAYFSQDKITVNNSTSTLPYTPQIDNPANNMLSSSTWMEISGSFTANGGESYIIIGSFAGDALTDTLVANNSSTSYVAFYSIDDISVTSCISGISNEVVMNDINVFPTPATNYLNVQVPPSLEVQTIKLINVQGQEIQNMEVNQFEGGDFVLNVADMPAGIYMLRLQLKEGTVTKKVLVVK